MILSLTLFAAWHYHQFDGFRHDVASAPVVVQALGEHYGLNLTIGDDELHRCMVLVHVARTPQEEVLDQLADVCLARWETTDSGRVLRLDRDAYAAREQADRAYIRERIVRWQAQLAADAREPLRMEQDRLDPSRVSPTDRLRMRILSTLDPHVLVEALITEYHVTWSSDPLADQPLPQEVGRFGELYQSEVESLQSHYAATPPWPNYSDFYSHFGLSREIAVDRFQLVTQDGKFGIAFQAEYDGQLIYNLDFLNDRYQLTLYDQDLASSDVVNLSYYAGLQRKFFADAQPPINSDQSAFNQIRNSLVGKEPLSLIPQEALLASAGSRGKDVIAAIPDEALYLARKKLSAGTDLNASLALMRGSLASKDLGTLDVYRPRLAWLAFQDRWDRRVGQDALHQVPVFGMTLVQKESELAEAHLGMGRSVGFAAARAHLSVARSFTASFIYQQLSLLQRLSLSQKPTAFRELPERVRFALTHYVKQNANPGFDDFVPSDMDVFDPYYRHRRLDTAEVMLSTGVQSMHWITFLTIFNYEPTDWTGDRETRRASFWQLELRWPSGDNTAVGAYFFSDRPGPDEGP